MTVRALKCPKCSAAVNVLATMQTVRCPACGNVFSTTSRPGSAASPVAALPAAAPNEKARQTAAANADDSESDTDNNSTLLLVGVCGGLALILLLCAVGIYTLTRGDDSSSAAADVASEPAVPVLTEPTAEEIAALRIVSIPEEHRRRVYDEVRASARTTTEKALMVPGSGVRSSLENMLDATHENTLRQLAALHDISVEEIQDIVIEGDLKNWDPSARSRVYRDGQRVYSDERTQGYQEKSPLK